MRPSNEHYIDKFTYTAVHEKGVSGVDNIIRHTNLAHNYNIPWVLQHSMGNYRIAGNFRGVQIFAFFEDTPLYAKLKYRPSSTSKTAAQELAAPNRVVHACKPANQSNEMDAKLAS